MTGDHGPQQRERAYFERLSEVRAAFARRAKVESGEVIALAGAFGTADARERLRDLAHRIRGTAGTLGFGEIADVAGAVEDAVDGGASDSEVRRLAAVLAGHMSSACDA